MKSAPTSQTTTGDLDQLRDAIREISRKCLTEFGKIDRVLIEEPKPVKEVSSLWTASILAHGGKARIRFRSHFDLLAAKTLASGAYGGRSPTGMTSDQAYDFMKEFCNLCVGKTKRLLANNEISVAVGLPAVTRGFEAAHETTQDYTQVSEGTWILASRFAKLFCSVRVEALADLGIKDFSDPDTGNPVDIL